jgi:YgiT-type zinc finger domain-containing protein
MTITFCPTCGSDQIKRVRRDWTDEFKGQTYTVPALEFWECSNCGERIYDREAMRRIEACSPAFAKPHTPRVRAKTREPIAAAAKSAA